MSELIWLLILIGLVSSLFNRHKHKQAKPPYRTGGPAQEDGGRFAPMPWQPPMTPPPVITPPAPVETRPMPQMVFKEVRTGSLMDREDSHGSLEGTYGSLGGSRGSLEGTRTTFDDLAPMTLAAPSMQPLTISMENDAYDVHLADTSLIFTGQEMIKAVIMTEILGKPVGRRCRK